MRDTELLLDFLTIFILVFVFGKVALKCACQDKRRLVYVCMRMRFVGPIIHLVEGHYLNWIKQVQLRRQE